MMKQTVLFAMALVTVSAGTAFAHCEIPCGIYDDSARVVLMQEHVTTIEKAINQIVELSAAGEKNYNQLVRWISNKEDHADQLQEVATQYFMFQRIKPADPSDQIAWNKYLTQLTLMHRITVHAMKAKQTTDLAEIETLRKLIQEFATAYFVK
ncbi:MAG: superoxide dismutase [Ni] [Candidatus Zixiibacteriota bacterium]